MVQEAAGQCVWSVLSVLSVLSDLVQSHYNLQHVMQLLHSDAGRPASTQPALLPRNILGHNTPASQRDRRVLVLWGLLLLEAVAAAFRLPSMRRVSFLLLCSCRNTVGEGKGEGVMRVNCFPRLNPSTHVTTLSTVTSAHPLPARPTKLHLAASSAGVGFLLVLAMADLGWVVVWERG